MIVKRLWRFDNHRTVIVWLQLHMKTLSHQLLNGFKTCEYLLIHSVGFFFHNWIKWLDCYSQSIKQKLQLQLQLHVDIDIIRILLVFTNSTPTSRHLITKFLRLAEVGRVVWDPSCTSSFPPSLRRKKSSSNSDNCKYNVFMIVW